MVAATQSLPIAPRPRHNELISSWLGRAAAHYDLDSTTFRTLLFPDGGRGRDRPDIDLDAGEAARLAEAFRLPPGRVAALDLRRVWPDLKTDWLPSVGTEGRARGELGLSLCHECLKHGHRSGGTYLDREAALPLILCHRHLTWRFDFCRFCRPKKQPRFAWLEGTVDLVCGDCHRLLRNPARGSWAASWGSDDPHLGRVFEILLLFESCLRSAWLGRAVRLEGVGQVAPAEFLPLVADLTRAVLAPKPQGLSLINYYDCGLLSDLPRHRPDHWRQPTYPELSPLYRAWVLSAVIAIVSSEETSLLFTGRYWSRYAGSSTEVRSLEWLFDNAADLVQAMLVRGSARWPARLRERMRVLHVHYEIDVDAVFARYEGRLREEEWLYPWPFG